MLRKVKRNAGQNNPRRDEAAEPENQDHEVHAAQYSRRAGIFAGMDKFVEDGPERAGAAIRAEVIAEFAEQLSTASFWQRLRIWRAIDAEVERRLERQAPPDALYLHG